MECQGHRNGSYILELPPTQSTRIMNHFFSRESQPKPSFVTVTGCGGRPNLHHMLRSNDLAHWAVETTTCESVDEANNVETLGFWAVAGDIGWDFLLKQGG